MAAAVNLYEDNPAVNEFLIRSFPSAADDTVDLPLNDPESGEVSERMQTALDGKKDAKARLVASGLMRRAIIPMIVHAWLARFLMNLPDVGLGQVFMMMVIEMHTGPNGPVFDNFPPIYVPTDADSLHIPAGYSEQQQDAGSQAGSEHFVLFGNYGLITQVMGYLNHIACLPALFKITGIANPTPAAAAAPPAPAAAAPPAVLTLSEDSVEKLAASNQTAGAEIRRNAAQQASDSAPNQALYSTMKASDPKELLKACTDGATKATVDDAVQKVEAAKDKEPQERNASHIDVVRVIMQKEDAPAVKALQKVIIAGGHGQYDPSLDPFVPSMSTLSAALHLYIVETILKCLPSDTSLDVNRVATMIRLCDAKLYKGGETGFLFCMGLNELGQPRKILTVNDIEAWLRFMLPLYELVGVKTAGLHDKLMVEVRAIIEDLGVHDHALVFTGYIIPLFRLICLYMAAEMTGYWYNDAKSALELIGIVGLRGVDDIPAGMGEHMKGVAKKIIGNRSMLAKLGDTQGHMAQILATQERQTQLLTIHTAQIAAAGTRRTASVRDEQETLDVQLAQAGPSTSLIEQFAKDAAEKLATARANSKKLKKDAKKSASGGGGGGGGVQLGERLPNSTRSSVHPQLPKKFTNWHYECSKKWSGSTRCVFSDISNCPGYFGWAGLCGLMRADMKCCSAKGGIDFVHASMKMVNGKMGEPTDVQAMTEQLVAHNIPKVPMPK